MGGVVWKVYWGGGHQPYRERGILLDLLPAQVIGTKANDAERAGQFWPGVNIAANYWLCRTLRHSISGLDDVKNLTNDLGSVRSCAGLLLWRHVPMCVGCVGGGNVTCYIVMYKYVLGRSNASRGEIFWVNEMV